jgi:hypothetical protein
MAVDKINGSWKVLVGQMAVSKMIVYDLLYRMVYDHVKVEKIAKGKMVVDSMVVTKTALTTLSNQHDFFCAGCYYFWCSAECHCTEFCGAKNRRS